MDPAVPWTEEQDAGRRSPERATGIPAPPFVSSVARHNSILTVAAALVTPILYLIFIARYATNSFYGDDWSVAPLVRDARTNHLSATQLWSQYNESRLLLGNIVDVLFGHIDQLDLRSVIFFSAALFIASYVLLLSLFHRYARTGLTPIPVLLIGVTWFSLADVQNSLWAFQVSWYLTVFFFVLMLFALKMTEGRRTLWFVIAIIAAVAASFSTVQGFLCWPLGALWIFWTHPSWRRAVPPAAVWLGATVATVALYFRGYDFSNNGCLTSTACSPRVALHHPLDTAGFFFTLIGNVIPDGINFAGVIEPVHDVVRLVVVGIALFVVAVFILVQSCRHRASTEAFPLPLLLIGFGLLFDVTITLGRGVEGPTGAGSSNRYVMANLILLTGVVMYAWAHIPARSSWAHGTWRSRRAWLAVFALAAFLIVQVIEASGFGLRSGRATSESLTNQARLVVNVDRVPVKEEVCEYFADFLYQAGWSPEKVSAAAEDHLGEFLPSSYRSFRAQGPPASRPECSKAPRP
jgi:hypothetical protein